MKAKKWVGVISGISVTVLILSTSLLIWSDSYSILHSQSTDFIDEPNRNFLKVEHILANPDRYNSIIFGSSRVGAILPSNIKDAKVYNMTYSEGIPREHLLNLKLFIQRGVKVKKVLLGLDEFSYQVPFEKHQQQWITKAHPLATKSSWFTFYAFYFFRLPTQHDKRQFLKKFIHPEQTITMDIENQEAFYNKFLTLPKSFRHDDPIYLAPTLYHGNTLNTTLQDIRDIVNLCKTQNIELIVFLNPIHHKTYMHTNKALLNHFRRELASITPYYDFSGPNAITTDNRNFVDTSHYTVDVGDCLLQYMNQSKNPIQCPISSNDSSYFKSLKTK